MYTQHTSREEILAEAQKNDIKTFNLENQIAKRSHQQFGFSVGSIVTAVTAVSLGAPLIGLASSLGGIATLFVLHNKKCALTHTLDHHLSRSQEKVIEWDKLFFNLGLINKEDEIPKLLWSETIDSDKIFYFKLPYGVDSHKALATESQIECALQRPVAVSYEDFKLVILVSQPTSH